MNRMPITVLCVLAWLGVVSVPAWSQGIPGATLRPEGKAGAPVARDAMKARMQERCKENPKQCEEMKAKFRAQREQCKADPQKCRDEMKARREERCKANPQQCAEMKAKMEQRREQCRANPEQCRRGARGTPDGK